MAIERFHGQVDNVDTWHPVMGYKPAAFDVSALFGGNTDVLVHVVGHGLEIRMTTKRTQELIDLLQQAVDSID